MDFAHVDIRGGNPGHGICLLDSQITGDKPGQIFLLAGHGAG